MSQILPPEMIPVKSSNLKAVGYRESEQLQRGAEIPLGVLFVAFLGKNGNPDTLYRYEKFPASEYEALMSASSQGSYHYNFIRNNAAYPCTQIG